MTKSGGWWHFFAPKTGILNFTGRWGGVKIIDYTTFSDVSYEPGTGDKTYKYILELNEPAPTDLLFEADNEDGAAAYFGFPAGSKEYSFEVNDNTCGTWNDEGVFVPKTMTSLSLKSPAESENYPFPIDIKRIYRVPVKVEKPTILLGDVNDDGDVSLYDILMCVDYILGKNPDGFVFANADIDENGEISLADILGIVDIILSSGSE